jgi:ribosomal protein S18 acetylase RimI-like enzyme
MEQSEEIRLRLAEARDLEALVEFNRAMALETEGRELDTGVLRAGVEGLLREPRHGFYVVAEASDGPQGEVVGSLMVTYEWSDWRNGLFWWIQSVYVTRPFRRRGIYRRLYEFVKARAAREETVCGFRLYVERDNEIAQQTYRRLGMEETHYKLFEELYRD